MRHKLVARLFGDASDDGAAHGLSAARCQRIIDSVLIIMVHRLHTAFENIGTPTSNARVIPDAGFAHNALAPALIPASSLTRRVSS